MTTGPGHSKPRADQIEIWNRQVQTTWNARAVDWDLMSAGHTVKDDRLDEIARLERELLLTPGARLLDAGCGTGQFAIAFAGRGCQVVGIDIAADMIQRAQKNAARAGIKADWIVGDARTVDLEPEFFDAIHARVMVQFSPEPAETLDRFRDLLKVDGRMFVSVPGDLSPIYNRSWRRHLPNEHPAVNYITPRELEQLLDHLGWEILDDWGNDGPSLSGTVNTAAGVAASELPIEVRRAAATTWGYVVRRR